MEEQTFKCDAKGIIIKCREYVLREDVMSKNVIFYTHFLSCLGRLSFFLFTFFLLQANMKMIFFKKYAPFNVFIRKNTFSIKIVFFIEQQH